jgi:hypothetical protein
MVQKILVHHILDVVLLSAYAQYERVCIFQILKWTSSDDFRKCINREESCPGLEGVQVGKFLNG